MLSRCARVNWLWVVATVGICVAFALVGCGGGSADQADDSADKEEASEVVESSEAGAGAVYLPVRMTSGDMSQIGDSTITWEYDENGSPVAWTREWVYSETGGTSRIERTYTCDDAGYPESVVSISDGTPTDITIAFELDADGLPTTETWDAGDWSNEIAYTYDGGELAQRALVEPYEDFISEVTWDYKNGYATSQVSVLNGEVQGEATYAFDLENSTVTVEQNGTTQELTFETDDAGNIVSVSGSNGSAVTIEWVAISSPSPYAQFTALNKTPWI